MSTIVRIIGVSMCLMGCIALWFVVPCFFRFLLQIFNDQFRSVAIGMTVICGLLSTVYGLMTTVGIGIVRLTSRSVRAAIPILLVASFSDVLMAFLIKYSLDENPIPIYTSMEERSRFQTGGYISLFFLATIACFCLLSAVFLRVYYKKVVRPTNSSDGK